MDERPRKDRLIQTRVPHELESTLKDEARKRRLSVSHLIRNVLEDAFSLVDNVVTEVDRVVTDSVEMAQALKRDAQRLAATARGETAHRTARDPDPASATTQAEAAGTPWPDATAGGTPEPLAHVYGFQELVLNRPAACANCEAAIARGSRAYLGMSDRPELPRVWLCRPCLDGISR